MASQVEGVRVMVRVMVVAALAACSSRSGPVDACAYPTIQAAIDDARPNATVVLCAGVHDESIRIAKALTLEGSPAGDALLCGGSSSAPVISVDAAPGAVVIDSLTVRPSAQTAARTGIAIGGSPDVEIRNVIVDGSNLTAAPSPSPPLYAIDADASHVTLDAVSLRNFSTPSVGCAALHAHGDSVVTASDLTVDTVACSGVLASDSDVSVMRGTIQRALTGVEVLSGVVHLADTTIAEARLDAIMVSGGELHATAIAISQPQRYGILGLGGLADIEHAAIDQPEEGIHVLLGTVSATDCTIDNPRGPGIDVGDAGLVTFGPGTIRGGSDGVSVVFPTGEVALDNVAIVDSTAHGIALHAGQVVASGGSIERAGQQGVVADGGSLLLSDMTIKDSMADGVMLSDTVSATLANLTVTGNAGWGVVCDGGSMGTTSSVMLDSCIGLFGGNALGGAHLFAGCELIYMCIDTGG